MSADLVVRVRGALANIERYAALCRELHDEGLRRGDAKLAANASAKANAYERSASVPRDAMEER